MSVAITIQETVNEVDITVNQNVITVNVTRTTGGGGGGVESVTGDLVNNTDPLNPIINTPSFAETLAEDNKTNDIPIVSNNGNGYAYVNDEQTVIGNDFGGTKKITMNEDSFAIETNVRATIDGKGLNLNTTTDGFGLPQVSTTNMNAIAFPTEGMLIRNTTEGKIYQFNGTVWEPLSNPPQTLAETLAEDNKTNNIHIISNNGLARVKLNDDYVQIEYEDNLITLSLAYGLQLYSDIQVYTAAPEMTAIIDNVISYTCPSFLFNYEEVATQPYADAKVADTISDGVTTVAPSQNAVFDALDLKQNTSTLIFDSFQKAIMRDNYFWFVPNAISSGASASFANSERISGASFQYLNNGAITRGLLAFNTTVVPGILAFSRRNDILILTGLEVVFTRKIQFNSNVSGQRFFSGISKGNQFVAPTNVEPNTLTDIVGVCQLSSSTNMHVVHNDASGTATTIDLGSSYPCTDSQYNYYITIEQTTTTYIVTVERVTVSTGASISTTNTLSTNIPVYNTGTIQLLTWISNNATAAIASYLDGGAIGNVKNQ